MDFCIFDPSSQTPPPLLTQKEIEEARDFLYPDVPPEKRIEFDMNNKKWISQAPRKEKMTEALENCLIIGINQKYAAAFKSIENEDIILRRKQQMQLLELKEFAHAWAFTLQRCQNRIQYETIHKKFLSLVKYDPSLRGAAMIVLKDNDLLKFRDLLPNESEDGKLISKMAERDLQAHLFNPKPDNLIVNPKKNKKNLYKINLFCCTGFESTWKKSKIDIFCLKDTVPSGHLEEEENKLSIAYYIDSNIICVQKINLETDKICKTRYFKSHCGNQSSPLLVASYGIVSDGLYIYHQNYEMQIENLFISSIYKEKDMLYIGTNNGGIYKVANGYKLQGYDMTRDNLCVFGLGKNLAQSIYSVTFFDDKDNLTINVERPVCAIRKGTFIISFDKYGVIRFNFTLHKQGEIQINPPDTLKINASDVQPWYSGIYMNSEGNLLRVIYPNGKVRTIKI